MKVSVLKEMKDFGGAPIGHANGQQATFRSVVCECLNCPFPSDQGQGKSYFIYLYDLGKKIMDNDEVELNARDREIILSRVTESCFYTTIKNTVYELLQEPVAQMRAV